MRFLLLLMLCTLLSPYALAQQNTDAKDREDIPEAYITEALAMGQDCRTNTHLQNYYNCACREVAFLNTRIDMGPAMSQSGLLMMIEDQCKDATFAAGSTYEDCMNSEPPARLDHEEFCTCLARTYARLYTDSDRSPGSKTFIALGTQARTTCLDPALARKLYGGAR